MSLRSVCFVLAFSALAGSGCGGNSAMGPAGSGSGDSASGGAKKKYRIAVIPKGTSHEYWKSVHAGAENAAKELGNVEVIWKGPQLEIDRDGQISIVQNFITKKVDGIVLAPLDSQALIQYVKEAKQENIPTVIFDSALDDESDIVSYVASDNHQAGVIAARRMGEVLGGKGNVILLRYLAGSESTVQREEGFLETLAKEFPEIKVISSTEYSGGTPETSLDKAQQLLLKFRDQVNGIFGVCEPNATGIYGALQEERLAGKVKFIGFDPNPNLIKAMREHQMDGIVLQDPVKMGYQAVITMVEHLEGKKVEKRISTGEHVATPENMDEPEMQKLLKPQQYGE